MMEKVKVGYIQDSFDMFNIDDLRKIQKAKEQCEQLVVGVYSDEYYKAKTGKEPIISCEDRMKIVNAMRLVSATIKVDGERVLSKEDIRKISDTLNNAINQTEGVNKKYKIGFVQGTFDMFHTGHYNLLLRAKELCETLIVGVNTDELVKEYKSKKTIVSYEERLEIIAAIECVDKAIGMEDRNKIKAARNIGFNALIMGNDWEGTEFYNIMEEELRQIGVDVVYLPYTKGISSTKLRAKINKDNDGNNIEEK